ncbi:MAG TPA: mobile mystery protein B, partial [Treponemataceae bacterium]|nr:mobile mystery protein B [Treponemataceae bacterium]
GGLMDILFEAEDNATPLTEEETQGLKQRWITLRSELNEMEMQGIISAERWLNNNTPDNILEEGFLLKLHKKMFEQVWTWAGTFRTTERNIGVTPYQIPIRIKNLFDDTYFWIENKTYSAHEIAIRFHHKLVWIHPFPNGNGRISRLMADLLRMQLDGKPLFWGASNLTNISSTRTNYIKALQKADRGDYTDLIAFTTGTN